MHTHLISVALALLAAMPQLLADWPMFRGPNASGVSPSAKPPARFGPDQAVLWKVPVPFSPSSPAVHGGRIFVTTYHDGELQIRAYDRKDGRLAWVRGVRPDQVEEFHGSDGSPAASSPATDGRRVVSYFGSFGVLCHDIEGKELWRHPLPVALSGGRYGSGTSPTIQGSRVLINRDQDRNGSLLALDLETGKVAWEVARPDFIGGFGTPILWRNQGVDEVVVPGSLRLKAYELATGRERWLVEGINLVVCTTPVVGDDLLFFAGWSPGKADSSVAMDWPGFRKQFDRNGDGQIPLSELDPAERDYARGLDVDRDNALTENDLAMIRANASKAENVLLAVKPGGTGNITASHVAWTHSRGLPYVPSPVHYQGRVYLIKDGGIMSCLDARSGKPVYVQERLGAIGSYYASPVAADGRIIVASVPGKVTVVKAGANVPEVLHQTELGERVLATPALAGAELYIRTQLHLFAFGNTPSR